MKDRKKCKWCDLPAGHPTSTFMHKQSPQYAVALRTLRELIGAEGVGVARCAYAEATSDPLRKGWAKHNKVIKSNGHICMTRIVGKQCNGRCGYIEPYLFPSLDHLTLWRREGQKAPILVSQPYSLWNIRELIAWADRYGLDLHISAGSFYYPGRTLMIEIMKHNDGVKGSESK